MDEPIPTLASVLVQVTAPPRGARTAARLERPAPTNCRRIPGWCQESAGTGALGQDAGQARRRRLGLTRGRSPSQPTLHRVLCQVDVAVLERVLGEWLQHVRAAWRRSTARWLDGIGIDGKPPRGARRLGAEDAYLLSAF